MLALLFALLTAALAGTVRVVEVRGSINPGSAAHLVGAIQAAEASGAEALVIRLDTPGGLVTSAREIVQAELTAAVPVVVFVEPSGARAGSAGVFITMAANVAAMASGTTIGAAHPVSLFGGGGGGDEEQKPDEVMEEKLLNDILAWTRAISEERGRNTEWAESAVRESSAVTAAEALELGVIDLVVDDFDELLRQLDGRQVKTRAGFVTLHTAGAQVVSVEMDLRQRVLHILGDPNTLYVLVAMGLLGLYVEFHNPGLVLPGLVGVVLLIGAAIGISILPFNVGGLVLIVSGFIAVGLEVWVGGKGIFAVVGGLCVVAGGLLLFDVEGLDVRVDTAPLLGIGIAVILAGIVVGWLVTRAHRRQVATGSEGLLGLEGAVTRGGVGGGWVSVHGENWQAEWTGELAAGAPVVVVEVRGLRLRVEIRTGREGPRPPG